MIFAKINGRFNRWLHEMEIEQRDRILAEVYRVLKSGGIFTLIDFHQPSNPIFWPGLALFLWLFETETAWQLIRDNLADCLVRKGFALHSVVYPVGGSLQIIQARKPL